MDEDGFTAWAAGSQGRLLRDVAELPPGATVSFAHWNVQAGS